jgi:hypothetical protein
LSLPALLDGATRTTQLWYGRDPEPPCPDERSDPLQPSLSHARFCSDRPQPASWPDLHQASLIAVFLARGRGACSRGLVHASLSRTGGETRRGRDGGRSHGGRGAGRRIRRAAAAGLQCPTAETPAPLLAADHKLSPPLARVKRLMQPAPAGTVLPGRGTADSGRFGLPSRCRPRGDPVLGRLPRRRRKTRFAGRPSRRPETAVSGSAHRPPPRCRREARRSRRPWASGERRPSNTRTSSSPRCSPPAVEALEELLRSDDPSIRLRAATTILDRVAGRPTQRTELAGTIEVKRAHAIAAAKQELQAEYAHDTRHAKDKLEAMLARRAQRGGDDGEG